MTDHEAKAREILDSLYVETTEKAAVSAISAALREATLAERERCAKIAEDDNSFMMLQDFGLQSAVMEKGQNIAAAIRSTTDE